MAGGLLGCPEKNRLKHGEVPTRINMNQPEIRETLWVSGHIGYNISWCHDVPWPVGQIPSTVPLMP